jgi:hypothetical protein
MKISWRNSLPPISHGMCSIIEHFFSHRKAFHPPSQASICAIETKDFIPSGHIDWFNNPIPTPDAFEEGNMANISPTVKIDISIKPGIIEEITIGMLHAPLKNSQLTKLSFRNIEIFFPGHIWRCPTSILL